MAAGLDATVQEISKTSALMLPIRSLISWEFNS